MKKQVLAVAALFTNRSAKVAVLDCAFLDDNIISWNDGELYCTVPFKTGVKVGLNNSLLIKSLSAFAAPSYSCDKNLSLIMKEGTKKLTLGGDDPLNFPVPLEASKPTRIGSISSDNLDTIVKAIPFASKDNLRPAMTHIQVHTHIVATDAHRLVFTKLETPLTREVLLTVKTVKLMDIFGGAWSVSVGTQREKEAKLILLKNEEGVTITQRDQEWRFPDWPVVVPTVDSETPVAYFNKKEIMQALKEGAPFSNKSTYQVILNLNSKAFLSFEDVDFSTHYTLDIFPEYDPKNHIQIGFNLKFLNEFLAICPDRVKVNYFSPTKCIILEDKYLLMPLMLNC
jgi:DNA polymerase III sliding clamp (beta) subunit (PCNA family)